ncbi:MAG TPA: ribbon-helix-helix domain-containing protein [Methanocorpusculum sp.]|nr:ribbon-helix-helix domain-containing protein [Methanocorpusculum sp.]
MSKPENDLQLTIRMPSTLKKEIDTFVADKGMTSLEFIRLAIKEKLTRETDILSAERNYITEEDFKRILLHIIRTDPDTQAEIRALKS